ncbi:MAG: hypothetical protein V1663_05535 [archaeon]
MVISKDDYLTPKAGLLITYKGTFNLDTLYKKSKTFFDSRRYLFSEKEHTEKVKSHANELKVGWEAERKVDDYVRFTIKSTFEVWDFVKKEDTYTGDLKINIIAIVDLDYRNTFFKFPFLLFVYNNFIIKRKIQDIYETKLFIELNEYVTLVKDIIKISK